MKKSVLTAMCLGLVFTATMLAAAIDGKWKMEVNRPEGKAGKGGPVVTVLELKSDGSKLTGSVSTSMGGRERSVDIKDGKLDGDKFSFTTQQRMRNGEVTVKWEGTVSGDEIKGTRSVEGRRALPFTAKKQ